MLSSIVIGFSGICMFSIGIQIVSREYYFIGSMCLVFGLLLSTAPYWEEDKLSKMKKEVKNAI